MHKFSLKFHQREVTQKLIIPYGYLVMERTRIVWKKKTNQREVTQTVRKGRQSFMHEACCLDLFTHCYEVSSKYSLCLPSYGAHKVSVKKKLIKRQ